MKYESSYDRRWEAGGFILEFKEGKKPFFYWDKDADPKDLRKSVKLAINFLYEVLSEENLP